MAHTRDSPFGAIGTAAEITSQGLYFEAEVLPEGTGVVRGYDFNRGVDYNAIMAAMNNHGFQAISPVSYHILNGSDFLCCRHPILDKQSTKSTIWYDHLLTQQYNRHDHTTAELVISETVALRLMNLQRKWRLSDEPIAEDEDDDDYNYGNLRDMAVREKVTMNHTLQLPIVT